MDYTRAIGLDIKRYEEKGGSITYPFPIEDFALKAFGIDIQYENFDLILDKTLYDPGDFFGILFPELDPISGYSKVIYINTKRKPFKLGEFEVPKE